VARTPSITPFLEFKFKKNCMIDLGDSKHYSIPCDMRPQPNPQSKRKDGSDKEIILPFFNFDFLHKVELKDELPHIPKQLPGMSKEHHQKLCDQAYERAARAKNFNDAVRERVDAYVRRGVLEIVNDPFEGEEEVEGLAELAAAFKAADAAKAEAEEEAAEAGEVSQIVPVTEPPAPKPKAPKK